MAPKLSTFIEEVPALQLFAAQLKRLQKLRHVYSDAVPNALSKVSQAGYLDGNTLVLIAFNGTAAASIRQQLPSLLVIIQRHEPEITGIRIEVQVGKFYTSVGGPGTQRRLSSAGVESLRKLAGSLPDSPLQRAVKRLAGPELDPRELNQNQSFDQEKERNCSEKYDKKPE
jgi:hypothetical protein